MLKAPRMIVLASFAAIGLAGCGAPGGGTQKPVHVVDTPGGCPKGGLERLDSSCCDANGKKIHFTGRCAGSESADALGISGALASGAALSGSSFSSIKKAGELAGVTSGFQTGGKYSAATAAQSKPLDLASGKTSPREELKAPEMPKVPTNAGGGNSATPASGGAGGGLSLAATSTGPAQNVPLNPEPHMVSASIAGYTGAGGGAAKTGAGGSGQLNWASLGRSTDGSAGAIETADYGKGGAQANPMGSADPEDYFTRLALDDSIFKAVEKRYRQKAIGWATIQK